MNYNLKFNCSLLIAHCSLLMTFCLLSSCNSNVVFFQTKTIPNANWNLKNTISFQYSTVNSQFSILNLYINVRNTTDYSFSNLYLFVNITEPDSKTTRDTVELNLANENGKWLGKGNGFIKDNLILYKSKYLFNKKGIYTFNITQAMRTTELKGISDVGLKITN